MKLSIIIVNYNVKIFLEQCLDSLRKALKGIDAGVIVVDNASSDGSLDYLQPLYPEVVFVYNKDNKGYAKANNQGIKMCDSEYVLLLNPDTFVGERTISRCLDFMDSTPDAGAAGVCMYTGDGCFLAESKRGFPTPMSSFWKLTGLSALFPKSKLFGKYSCLYLDEKEIHHVDVLCGAFLLFRRSVSDMCGLLDEDFFMYGEDIDFSYRLECNGYRNYYLPYPIIHYKGESTKKNSYAYVRTFYDAMLIFFRKHYGQSGFLLYSFIKFGIYARGAVAMLPRFLKKAGAMLLPFRRRPVRKFIVIGPYDYSEQVREILESNGCMDDDVLYAAFLTVERGESSVYLVFQREDMSYDDMIEVVSAGGGKMKFAVYSSKRNTLVTPDNQYVKK